MQFLLIWKKLPNAVKVLLLTLVVLGIFYALKQLGMFEGTLRFDTNANVNDTAENATPKDGSTVDPDWEVNADNYANAQYSAMAGYGTDEEALIYPLTELTGGQLIQVYQAFGIKDGKNLFQWYSDELAESTWTGLAYYNENVEGCESYFDACSEVQIMRAIWDKSGLPITF